MCSQVATKCTVSTSAHSRCSHQGRDDSARRTSTHRPDWTDRDGALSATTAVIAAATWASPGRRPGRRTSQAPSPTAATQPATATAVEVARSRGRPARVGTICSAP
ncbi:hypothetical protein GCM10009584_10790 [Ornithinimicrobium humiphilum]